MARPKKQIDPNIVRNLAAEFKSPQTIAAILSVDRRTLEKGFSHILEEGRHEGKARIIETLMDRAKSSDRVLIHIADRFLGPVKQETDHSGKIEVVITDYRTKK